MKLKLFASTVLLVIGACHHSTPSDPGVRRTAITNATVIDAGGAHIRNTTILIEGNRISRMVPHADWKPAPGTALVDATGKFVIPGLWDSHTHLTYVGECGLPLLLSYGITSVRDLGSTQDLREWEARIADGSTVGPRIWMAGPNIEMREWMDGARAYLDSLLSSPQFNSFPLWKISPRLEMSGPGDAKIVVDSLHALGVDIIKFRNLDAPRFRALANETRKRGMRLSGHAPKGISLAEAAEAGLMSIEHGDGIASELKSLTPDSASRILGRIAAAGTMLTPTLVSDGLGVRPDSAIIAEFNDSLGVREPRRLFVSQGLWKMWDFMVATRGAGGPGDPGGYAREAATVRAAHAAGVSIMAGTDLGILLMYPGTSLHEELQRLVQDVGMNPLDALRAATVTPARFMNVENQIGRIAPSYFADLVVLDEDPLSDIKNTLRIHSVIANGRVFSKQELARLQDDVRQAVRSGGRQCRLP